MSNINYLKMNKKKIRNIGLDIGSQFPKFRFNNFDKQVFETGKNVNVIAYIFISLYCSMCIDLLPHLNDIKKAGNFDLILLSNGDYEDHIEMVEYFNWNFPVLKVETREMDELFKVNDLPFMIFVKDNIVFDKAPIYNIEDFIYLIKGSDKWNI